MRMPFLAIAFTSAEISTNGLNFRPEATAEAGIRIIIPSCGHQVITLLEHGMRVNIQI